jgi:nitrite reductase/ring-hydroxylating ferredoxin subunit
MNELTNPRFPFPLFPNGWFQIAYGDELAIGQVEPIHYFGKDLVLFRGEDGEVHVFNAFCPHLGAHLGHGGCVEGTSIRCPFHGWRFDADGRCDDIPYAKRIPPAAALDAWHVRESNGIILVFHHADGAAPDYEIPEIEEFGSEQWTRCNRLRWKVRSANQEMGENAVDRAHFRFVHGTLEVPASMTEFDGPILRMRQNAPMKTPKGIVDGQIESTSYGFGLGVTRFSGIAETVLIGCTTPIDGHYVDVRFSFSVKKAEAPNASAGSGKALIADIEKQMNEDIPIWENKAYLPRPVLCEEDGPIGRYRKWSAQFYSAPRD